MLEVSRDTDVYTARDEHVGSIDRIILDPLSGKATHVVVRKGLFLPEDKLIRTEDIATATTERINLRQDVVVDELVPFIEQYYVPVDDEAASSLRLEDAVFHSTWYGPIGISTPVYEDTVRTVTERNIPDRLTALEAGAPVFASDRHELGHLDSVYLTDAGMPTHFVVRSGGLRPERRAVPVSWVEDIAEDVISLGATQHMVEAIPPLRPGE